MLGILINSLKKCKVHFFSFKIYSNRVSVHKEMEPVNNNIHEAPTSDSESLNSRFELDSESEFEFESDSESFKSQIQCDSEIEIDIECQEFILPGDEESEEREFEEYEPSQEFEIFYSEEGFAYTLPEVYEPLNPIADIIFDESGFPSLFQEDIHEEIEDFNAKEYFNNEEDAKKFHAAYNIIMKMEREE